MSFQASAFTKYEIIDTLKTLTRTGGGTSMAMDEKQRKIIAEFYNEKYKGLLAYAKQSLGDVDLASEAINETFEIACKKPEKLINSENPYGWLTNTLKNVINNMKRKRNRWNLLFINTYHLDENLLVSHESQEMDTIDLYYSELLSLDDYNLIKRIVLDRVSIPEAAREFGISTEACKKRIQRAKKKLKRILEENE